MFNKFDFKFTRDFSTKHSFPDIILIDVLKFFIGIKKNYHINNAYREIFSLVLNKKGYPLKDDLHRLQKYISKESVEKLKYQFACLLYYKRFVSVTLTYIDGHVIPYFGLKPSQKLKHSTRNKIMKAVECFNVSSANGDPFYFVLDVNKQGMRKTILVIAKRLIKLFGEGSIKVIIYDKGGNSDKVCDKLSELGVYYITLTPSNEHIDKEIRKEVLETDYEDYVKDDFNLNNSQVVKTKKAAQAFLQLRKQKKSGKVPTIERCGVLLLEEKDEYLKEGIRNKHVLRTNIPEWVMPNIIDLFEIYSMHWCQEQMHAETKNDLDIDSCPKNFKKMKVTNKEAVNRRKKIRKQIKKNMLMIKKKNEDIIFSKFRIKKFDKVYNNKKMEQDVKDVLFNAKIECELKIGNLKKEVKEIRNKTCFLKKKLSKIAENPTYYELREEPAEYYILMKYMVCFLNNFITRKFTRDGSKLQMKRSVDMIYKRQADVWVDEQFFNVEYVGLRTREQKENFSRVCEFLNSKKVQFMGKTMRFMVKKKCGK